MENRDVKRSEEIIKHYKKWCVEETIGAKKGAILFSVCRGKYSEGYNFSGKLCRAVIIIGVPNLSFVAPKT